MSKAKDHEYERRMENWSMWRISEGRCFGSSRSPVYNLMPRPPRGENVMPLLAGEAQETDQAVRALRSELLRAVEIWYLREGTIRQKRAMLRCREEQMMKLLDQARLEILKYLYERAAKLRGYAARVQLRSDDSDNAIGGDFP